MVSLGGTRDPSQFLLSWVGGGGAATGSGIHVTPAEAMKVPAVACAVRAIAEGVAQLALVTYRRGADGAKERASDHPAYRLLHDDANAWTSSFDLRRQLTVDCLLQGNGAGFVNRVGGRATEITRLEPEHLVISRDETDGGPTYRYGSDVLPRDQVMHLSALSLDGIRGKSPVQLAAEAIGTLIAQERHAGRIFANAGRPAGIISHPGELNAETKLALAEQWNKQFSGKGAGSTAILDEGAKFEPLSFNSVDLQFMELRRFGIEEVARIFRIPPIMLAEFGRATWSNSEEMGRQFLIYTLMPWIKAWESAIRRSVFSPQERDTLYAEFLLDDLLRADTARRAEAYSKLIAARILSPNEARAMENLPPYAGGDTYENPNTSTAVTSANDGATP